MTTTRRINKTVPIKTSTTRLTVVVIIPSQQRTKRISRSRLVERVFLGLILLWVLLVGYRPRPGRGRSLPREASRLRRGGAETGRLRARWLYVPALRGQVIGRLEPQGRTHSSRGVQRKFFGVG